VLLIWAFPATFPVRPGPKDRVEEGELSAGMVKPAQQTVTVSLGEAQRDKSSE
jgi:hypothetical protein